MKYLFTLVIIVSGFKTSAQELTREQYRDDVEFFWNTVKSDYCYWDKKKTDWEAAKRIYLGEADTVSSRSSLICLLEKMFNEIYDAHASLNTNTPLSQRLVPSGADIWAEYINGKPLITDIRPGFGADKAGMLTGMEIVAVNDVPVAIAVKSFSPKTLTINDREADGYALRSLLAGNHLVPRKITVLFGKQVKDFYPDMPVNMFEKFSYNGLLESVVMDNNIGYIRINNRLWDNNLIQQFDSALDSLLHTKALILDMRETPGGGNTTVARAMISRFIAREGFYQHHELTAEERETGVKRSWKELVSPRGKLYKQPLYILVNHWTGSVGEGIVIGFDAFKRAVIVGDRMAGLNGANYSYQLPHSGIGFSFPVEKLFHMNGIPRELFSPSLIVQYKGGNGRSDAVIEAVIKRVNKEK
ncbi:MAG TPA: S41 family peptidase [Chitinophagaceae bacterium]|nr:S41 family peptidase [Chitinophagaceae bacterium]